MAARRRPRSWRRRCRFGGSPRAVAPGAEPLREAQLVDDDHEDVRAAAGAGRRAAPVARGRRRRGLTAVFVGRVGQPRDAQAGAGERAAGGEPALEERAPIDSLIAASGPMLVHARSHPRAGRRLGALGSRGRRAAAAAQSAPDVRPGDIEQLRAAGRRGDRLAAAGQSRRIAADRRSASSAFRRGELSAVHASSARAPVRTRAACAAYSQGDGASFVPARPFAEGERVTVHGARCASAASSSARCSTAFAIASEDPISSTPETIHPGTRGRDPALSLAPGPAPADA